MNPPLISLSNQHWVDKQTTITNFQNQVFNSNMNRKKMLKENTCFFLWDSDNEAVMRIAGQWASSNTNCELREPQRLEETPQNKETGEDTSKA